MHQNKILISILYTVILQVYSGNNSIKRVKRQEAEEPWVWGYVDVDTENRQIDTTSEPTPPPAPSPDANSTDTEPNPCDEPDLQMPDFSRPGLRISEKKCFEYIWQIKYREHQYQKNVACTKWIVKHSAGGVQFAIGGRDALPGEYPHMAGIGWKAAVGTWIFKCGGSLISDKFVLTAAHCTKASPLDTTIADPVPKIVRLGDKNIIDLFANGYFPRDINITRIIVHPQYKSPKKYFDIALLELQNSVEFSSNLQPACLWSGIDTRQLGTQVTLTGWGVVETAGLKTSPVLQVAEVDLIDSQLCDKLLRPMCNRLWCGIQDHQVCAGKLAGGVDSCQGDSGGPLQVEIRLPKTSEGKMHYVIGVTSFGFKCAQANTPGVYTRVASFIDWVESNVWPTNSK